MFHEDDERIRRKAHEIWEQEGRPEGRADAHWEMARELLAQEQNQQTTLQRNPSRGGDDTAERQRPVEPLLAVENMGDIPGIADQGEELQYPTADRRGETREG
jgi:hypothetical protein